MVGDFRFADRPAFEFEQESYSNAGRGQPNVKRLSLEFTGLIATAPSARPPTKPRIDHASLEDKYGPMNTSTDERGVLRPRAEASYENAATIALNVWPVNEGWRAIYAGIGTRFGAYSICEATSVDGLNWRHGRPGENLALAPGVAAWENKMVEYPHVVREGSKLRLFYCGNGNGYGTPGIGTALAEPIA